MVHVLEQWIKSNDGVDIYTKTWEPAADAKTIATCVLVHGLGEHINRYNTFCTVLANAGIKVHAFDQRGFGRTGRRSGILGSLESFDRALLDIKEAENRLRSSHLPHFLFGHSMGGGLALRYALKYPENLKGVISSAPCIGLGKKCQVSLPEYYAIRAISSVLGTLVMHNPVDPKLLAHNQSVGVHYVEDPNVHPYVTFGTAAAVVLNGEYLKTTGAMKFPSNLPLLVVHGTDDMITDCQTSKEFVQNCASTDKTFTAIPQGFHEMHMDDGKENIFNMYKDFILSRSKSAAK